MRGRQRRSSSLPADGSGISEPTPFERTGGRTLSLGLAQRQTEVHRRDPLRLRNARVEVVEAVLCTKAANGEPVKLVIEQEAFDEPAKMAVSLGLARRA